MVHEWRIKVRASETDGLGHVSNISYFIYLEEARIELFRLLGTPLSMNEWKFILASTTCDFVQQAYFDEQLTIRTTINKIGRSSFHLLHHIENERGLIARGKAVIVHFDFEKQASAEIPPEMRKKLEQYLVPNEVKEV